MFGKDFFEKAGSCPYIEKDESKRIVKINEMLRETTEDLKHAYDYAPSHHCPFLMDQNLGNPYQRNQKNVEEIQNAMSKYLCQIGLIKVSYYAIIFRMECLWKLLR